MSIVAKVLICLIAAEALFIMILEMFAWESKGDRFFPEPVPGFFELTKSMAANQGLYNGFLGAGLIWSACVSDPVWAFRLASFFLICVAVAGVYGTLTADKGIFVKQALPAIIVLVVVMLVH